MKFTLESIVTEGKPGSLCDINLDKIEKDLNINFKPNQFFYLTDLNSYNSRGKHSNSNVQELLICLEGSFDINLNNGKHETKYNIRKNEGVYIGRNIWLDFYNFKNCIIFVLAEIDNEIKKKSIYDFTEFCNLNNKLTNE